MTYFLLSTGAAAIIAIISSIAAGMPLPYVPAALLWLNVVTNGMQDVALAFGPGEPDVLTRPPRRRAEGIVTRVLWERTALAGTVMAIDGLWLFTWAMDAGLNDAQSRGAALTTLVIAMAAHRSRPAGGRHRAAARPRVRHDVPAGSGRKRWTG